MLYWIWGKKFVLTDLMPQIRSSYDSVNACSPLAAFREHRTKMTDLSTRIEAAVGACNREEEL